MENNKKRNIALAIAAAVAVAAGVFACDKAEDTRTENTAFESNLQDNGAVADLNETAAKGENEVQP